MYLLFLFIQGLVEKWLLQVEELMVSSIRDVCIGAVCAYSNVPRSQWVLEWPGMVILCASSVHWTAEVTEAITDQKLPVSFHIFFINL